MNALRVCLICGCLVPIAPASVAAIGPVPAVASSIGKAILKYFGKQGSEEASEYLTKKGGTELIERVAGTATREGGQEAVDQVAKLTRQYGPEALAALNNSPSIVPVIQALDELPASQVSTALARLAAGAPGRELAEMVGKFGVVALKSELKHPGIGLILVRSLGDEGADLASRLSSDQAIAVGRHVESLAQLPQTQRQGILALVRNDTERMVAFLGRFAEANPGKTLFTVATTTVILAEPERILGGDEVVFDADGNPIVVSKSGLVGRSAEAAAKGSGAVAEHLSQQYLRPLFLVVLAFATTFAVVWAAIKLWHTHHRQQLSGLATTESATEPKTDPIDATD